MRLRFKRGGFCRQVYEALSASGFFLSFSSPKRWLRSEEGRLLSPSQFRVERAGLWCAADGKAPIRTGGLCTASAVGFEVVSRASFSDFLSPFETKTQYNSIAEERGGCTLFARRNAFLSSPPDSRRFAAVRRERLSTSRGESCSVSPMKF